MCQDLNIASEFFLLSLLVHFSLIYRIIRSSGRGPGKQKMVSRLLKTMLRKAETLSLMARHPNLYKLKTETKGMLSLKVYQRLYDLVCKLPDLDIVEVGGASGTGSIAIATAMRDSGKKNKLIAIEKCEGGSRIEEGSYSENLRQIKTNF